MRRWWAVALGLWGLPSALGAQTLGSASSMLPPEHWAVDALRRADALGLLPDYLPAQRAVRVSVAGDALRQAARRAAEGAPVQAELARAWELRFQREFPHLAADSAAVSGSIMHVHQAAVGLATGWRAGALAAGTGVFPPNVPKRLENGAGIAMHGALSVSAGRHLNLLVAPEAGTDGGLGGRWDATVGWPLVAVSAGFQPVWYGAGERAVVLRPAEGWHRVQAETVRPVVLRGPFRLLGPISLHTSVGTPDSERHPGDPLLWTASLRGRPHPRFTASVNRAALFGGDSVAQPTNLGNVARLLGGWQTGGFENQVVSLELGWRPPTERWLPLFGYIEWGFDDAAGAIGDVPGIVAGVMMPAVPGAPTVAAGIEAASFAHSCCNNPPWYRHAGHPGGWAVDDLPLGHPLGGDGTELHTWLRADLVRIPVAWEAGAWLRRRGAENLFAPTWVGRSVGASAEATWHFSGAADGQVQLEHEFGDGWNQTRLQASISRYF